MDTPLVIRGRLIQKSFVADDPMPDMEGPAELIVHCPGTGADEVSSESMFRLFGKARELRSAEDIDLQIQQERQSWNRA